ncbi:hypothetical protein CH330_06090 [candidate division WOR-3 bacterium JGI_Cruoil_03_51_56]|uniref:Type II secretion system protein GspG C-terminal domain-containing protein n=1 Tax=candidate division WOR-3 bacterium JGI_Cruoil_03_51_56 TaxID=1973747 RepID=A0A235BSS6_UNCW3|nr:MAG: hypothetical protein CH330_06090 [candidate division WOR-3 bacterium JGI_Cruoil_03_51_56]
MKLPRMSSRGVTLLELLIVMMILSIILTAAVKTWDVTLERGRFESTRRRLDQLAGVIVGNPDYTVAGQRVDFGYIGDLGKLPDSLSDLVQDHTGLAHDSSGWRGPYIRATFNESPEGYRTDAWGDTIAYNRDSLFVRSYGGYGLADRSKWITRRFSYTKKELTGNEVTGQMLDVHGNPPPSDSIVLHPLRFGVILDYPINGKVRSVKAPIDINGQFDFIAVSQGTYPLRVYYFEDVPPPSKAETTLKYITVYPGIGARDLQMRVNVDWEIGLHQ